MDYKVMFFDADGVILKGGTRFTDKLVETYGLDFQNILPFFHGPFIACSEGKADLKEELTKVVSIWGWKGTVDELMHFWFTEGTVFDWEVIELARRFADTGIHCFVTTGQEKYRGEFIKEKIGYGHPFEDVFYSAELGIVKRDPKFLELLYDRVKHLVDRPSSILVIDDSKNIIENARSLGCSTLFIQSPNDFDELKKLAKNHL